jgi:hypothetical protein
VGFRKGSVGFSTLGDLRVCNISYQTQVIDTEVRRGFSKKDKEMQELFTRIKTGAVAFALFLVAGCGGGGGGVGTPTTGRATFNL